MGEVRFEEARDIEMVEVFFKEVMRGTPRLEYLRKYWPQERVELLGDLDQERPGPFGWARLDDTFTPEWVEAATEAKPLGKNGLRFTFKPLRSEIPDFPGAEDYDVTFRRTLALRVTGSEVPVRTVRVDTRSRATRSKLLVELHAGSRTPSETIEVSGYNAVVRRITPGPGTHSVDRLVTPAKAGRVGLAGSETHSDDPRVHVGLIHIGAGSFELEVAHMLPVHRYAHDEGHLTFCLGGEAFTISLEALRHEGPIWFAEMGMFINWAEDPETFTDYRRRTQGLRTIAQQVTERPEQSLTGAMNGQPRPHPIPYCFGCKHARQKFWLEPNGDLVLNAWTVTRQPGRDTMRWKNTGNGRFFFGLERWTVEGRSNDPWPLMAYNLRCRKGQVRVHQQAFAVPLGQSILAGEPKPDETMAALLRFRFENAGDEPAVIELPLAYSQDAGRSHNRRDELVSKQRTQTDASLPICEKEALRLEGNQALGEFQGMAVLRLVFETDMNTEAASGEVRFRKELLPGERCELLLRIPYVALETQAEIAQLERLDFERCYAEMAAYWRSESRKGAQIHTPEAHLNAAYAGHLPIILMSDFGHPDGSGIVNTSVGTNTYGNYTNESVMILEELEQRGLPEEVRRRLAVWTRYQGTLGLHGRFSDHEGVFYGANGLESGQSYNQHHGWALWYLARHYLHTGDGEWFAGVVENVVRGAEWIARQRRLTLGELPNSRGWERGFLPAGALEDVDDYFYWLSTNCLTWRGLDTAAQALEKYGHPQAGRYRREADAYRQDLVRGYERSRQHSPLIRLRDGRWIPHYPSRLYNRGRDFGWIREVLEGSVYLLISGLYRADSREGGWILDDFLDTRYMNPPFGYRVDDPGTQWYDCGGFSVQPNLLAGLLPHLERDEVEIYLWMFFNAWAACYREEVQAMVEHPLPLLGFNNSAPFKTSDQSNAMKWLVYMFVYEKEGLLHLGRAIPRAWFAGEESFGAWGISTATGKVSVEYRPMLEVEKIEAEVELEYRQPYLLPILIRFRHPEKKPIQAVEVNGRPHGEFDLKSGDVRLPVQGGKMVVTAFYGK
jgi:hypothetical protein